MKEFVEKTQSIISVNGKVALLVFVFATITSIIYGINLVTKIIF